MFGPQSEMWTKFFTITFNEEETPNNIKIWTDIRNYLGNTDFTCVDRRKGLVLVDAKTEANAEKLKNLQSICKTSVSVDRDEVMNSIRGTALVPDTEYDNLSELSHQIREQAEGQNLPVSEVTIFPVTSKCTGKVLQIAKLTFQTRALPPKITIGFREVPIKEDLPKPRQCQKCWKFGHRADVCDAPECCPICSSSDHNLLSCPDKGNSTFKGLCPNCGELGHTGLSKKCVMYCREYETLLLMRRKGIKKVDARKLLEEAGRFSGTSYARRADLRRQQHQQQTAKNQQQNQNPRPSQQQQPTQAQQQPQDSQKQSQSQQATALQKQQPQRHQQPATQQEPQPQRQHVARERKRSPQPQKVPLHQQQEEPPPQQRQSSHPQKVPEPLNTQQQPPPHQAPIPEREPTSLEREGIAPEGRIPTPEENMRILFEEDSDEFLSMELESIDREASSEDLLADAGPPAPKAARQNQVQISKCPQQKPMQTSQISSPNSTPENIPSGENNETPLGSSSPRGKKSTNNIDETPNVPSTAPSKLTPTTSTNQGAIPKLVKRDTTKPKKDGQHSSAPSCGCHTCISELCITKMLTITPGQNPSKKIRDLIKKRKIYRATPLETHHEQCICKTHLERAATIPLSRAQTTGKKQHTNYPSTQPREDEIKRRDPRVEPSPPKGKKSPPKSTHKQIEQSIDVITSR